MDRAGLFACGSPCADRVGGRGKVDHGGLDLGAALPEGVRAAEEGGESGRVVQFGPIGDDVDGSRLPALGSGCPARRS